MPLKLKVFIWLASQNRIQTGAALKQKNWKGNPNCILCGVLEDVDHIFFQCSLARFVWACFKEALGWDRAPNDMGDFFENWIPLGCRNYGLKLFTFSVVVWVLWTTRNKMAIDKCFPESTNEVFFTISSCLQRWRALLQAADIGRLDEYEDRIKTWMVGFRASLEDRTKVEDFL